MAFQRPGRFRWEETVEGYDRVVHELLARQ